MKEIDKNKEAWNLLAKDHYNHYKKVLEEKDVLIIDDIINELGNLKDKTLIHLQCNIGSDTISLKRLGLKSVIGVDLSDQSIYYANKLKEDFKVTDTSFIQSDVLEIDQLNLGKFDIVFTSEGVLGWLPDLNKWAQNIRKLLKDDGFFYVFDSHPVFHVFDEVQIGDGKFIHQFDYFTNEPDKEFELGGYASDEKLAENYWWNHSLSSIISALISAGLKIEFFHEFDYLFWKSGNMEKLDMGKYQPKNYKNKFPFSYSIKATLK
jgi:SAM-dependent methyltransferase